MNGRPDRTTQQVLLLLLGVVVLVVAGSDRYLDYVRAGFRPLLLGAGVVVVLLALSGLRRSRGAAGHDHPGPAVGWLLAAPVAVVLVVAPPALGSYTASRQSAAPVAVPDQPSSPGIGADDPGTGHRTMTLFDYYVWSQAQDTSALEGRRVRLVGFVSPRAAGGWYVTRFDINCCAADATAIRVAVPDGPAEFEPDDWVEVVGTHVPPQVDPAVGYPEPTIDAASVVPVEAPAEPYE
ncbi:TIGR03943 family putative permease subunit [Modestobacter sp. VKM Ac-2978]|uniref:TIGR03943 family putative permease subunit n=1 Tax=Modestobacter sp. VKM Ac-2978 TaxID=3004132 RepID=UPI0022AA4730|nr:TIGR03943 family protein [Modestobacter sp. VKM Ac-2978]MCZ2848839.1 TIGR03943 family protein [Modestobacter sp. VKM Ac-2978]